MSETAVRETAVRVAIACLLGLVAACSRNHAAPEAASSTPAASTVGSAKAAGSTASSESGLDPIGGVDPSGLANSADRANGAASANLAELQPAGGVASAPSMSGALPRAVAPKPEIPDDMSLVPAGTFSMGANDEGEMDERPAHEVTVAAFLLDKTEVTNAAYEACVDERQCRAPVSLVGSPLTHGMHRVFSRPQHPVVGISWDDAKTYCEWRSRRLPREAEWERAARADDQRRYVWGNEAPDPKRHGVFGGRATTEPVGSFPDGQSAFGQLDLAGNVWEWMADDYDPFAYERSGAARGIPGGCAEIQAAQDQLRREHKQGYTGSNPIPNECEKVLRGGAYNYRASGLRNSNRVHHPKSFRIAVAGFRCARDY